MPRVGVRPRHRARRAGCGVGRCCQSRGAESDVRTLPCGALPGVGPLRTPVRYAARISGGTPMDISGERSEFFELDRPPRLVRRESTGLVCELITDGWRRAPWLRRQLEGRTPESDLDDLSRRCRQRLN